MQPAHEAAPPAAVQIHSEPSDCSDDTRDPAAQAGAAAEVDFGPKAGERDYTVEAEARFDVQQRFVKSNGQGQAERRSDFAFAKER